MKIVVGYLDTPEGHAALERGIEEAQLRDAELVVVHSMRGGESSNEVIDAREDTEAVDTQLDEAGVPHVVRTLARDMDPGDDLVALANEEGAGLIVIGIRRRSPVGKLVLGSNAQDILLKAECPVLAVKAADE